MRRAAVHWSGTIGPPGHVVGGFEGIPACRMVAGPESVVLVGVQTAVPSGSGAACAGNRRVLPQLVAAACQVGGLGGVAC